MDDAPEEIDELLAAICDDLPGAIEPAGERFRAVRELARIAEFSRRIQRADDAAPAPATWGGLRILESLGGGAHAEVYRAWDETLHREVALKLLRAGADDVALLEEGRRIARIRHPNVVAVHGVERHHGRIGLSMDLVPGPSLERRVRDQGPLAAAEARRLGLELGSALAAVHEAGLLHRDVKPANVLIANDGTYLLADFGIGARTRTPSPHPSGTPMYAAPEILAGGDASERSDLYALGLVLYYALTGRHPFEGETLASIVRATERGPVPPLGDARRGLPRRLVATIERAAAPDPAARFASVRAFVAALAASSMRLSLRWAAIALLPIVAAAAWLALRPRAVPQAASPPAPVRYAIDATFFRHDAAGVTPLVAGDAIRPGDRLSLELHSSRPTWVYVLDEDDRGEHYLLFPQPMFETTNPLPGDSALALPGAIGGTPQGWAVTNAGGREYLLVVASPRPVPAIESELASLPAPRQGEPIRYAPVGHATIDHLRGAGGVAPLADPAPLSPRTVRVFDQFRALAGREADVEGVWIRQLVLENPPR